MIYMYIYIYTCAYIRMFDIYIHMYTRNYIYRYYTYIYIYVYTSISYIYTHTYPTAGHDAGFSRQRCGPHTAAQSATLRMRRCRERLGTVPFR